MAFNKYAKANVTRPAVSLDAWDKVRHQGAKTQFNARNAAKVVLQQYDPKQYLLTHCTIIASVDTEAANVPLGKQVVDGFQIDRKYLDYRITPETLKYINNNCFVPGTSILMGDGTEKPIEKVQVGDQVVSHTGMVRTVTEVFARPFNGNLRRIRRLGDNRPLEVTPEHPFYAMVPATTDFSWVLANKLEKGDFLSTPRLQGDRTMFPVRSVEEIPYNGMVYNFETETDHSYVANGVAVHNCDAWERKLLLSSFRTFTGGENYVEHIQIPEMSKGKIIDSVARDIGDSVYVDILIATDRKHDPLVKVIERKRISGLSMGCQVSFTTCTKCGNVAYDETQLCPHVKYSKGQEFYDAQGRKNKVAELCGHVDAEPGSVRFIEASWVANPAFTGAVLRDILSPKDVADLTSKMGSAFLQGPRTSNGFSMQKAARQQVPGHVLDILAQDFSTDPQESATPKEEKKPESTGLSKAVDDLANEIRDHVTNKIRDEVTKDEVSNFNIDENQSNESLIKSALTSPHWQEIGRQVLASTGKTNLAKKVLRGLILHKHGGWQELVKTGSFSGRDLLAVSRQIDLFTRRSFRAGESKIYATVLAVNGVRPFRDANAYLTACRNVIGRDLTVEERVSLVEKGRLYDLGS